MCVHYIVQLTNETITSLADDIKQANVDCNNNNFVQNYQHYALIEIRLMSLFKFSFLYDLLSLKYFQKLLD